MTAFRYWSRERAVFRELISLIERVIAHATSQRTFFSPRDRKRDASSGKGNNGVHILYYSHNSIALLRHYTAVPLCECVISESRAAHANETRWQTVIWRASRKGAFCRFPCLSASFSSPRPALFSSLPCPLSPVSIALPFVSSIVSSFPWAAYVLTGDRAEHFFFRPKLRPTLCRHKALTVRFTAAT